MAEDSLLRVLVSTDNHLGVWEKEEDRKHDSFRAFEEVLQLAKEHDVDLLLLGGDLFHDNKPSRTTVNRAIELLNKYCLGDRPVQIQVLNSNQADIFVNGCVNFDNPNINVGLPVFTIHGNHDDPSGADNLSAVDLLSTCGLVNYFGKVLLGGNNIGTIKLQPVLIRKGDTKLALYGLGNVRDERLGRLFQTPGCVQWLRPASTPEIPQEDWLNLFVLHQNRIQHGPNAKNCLQERHLPGFLDLVVWGHEHECFTQLQDLQKPPEGDKSVQVLQPGSSVATALSEGESKPKHAFLLEFLVDKWRSIQLPLSSVRPFMWDSITLGAVDPPLDPEDTDALTAVLERKVNAMIQQANRASAASNPPPATNTNSTGQQQHPQQHQQPLPLIRLRVDYTGFGTVNSQRFGQKYVGKVANPHDMLLWAKAAAKRVKAEQRAAEEEELMASGLGLTSYRPEQLDQARIEDLVAANLQAKLDILHPDDLAQALHQFVDKEEKQALADCVTHVLQQTQVQVLSRPGGLESAATGGGGDEGDEADGVAAAPIKDEDIAEVINLCVQQRAASKHEQTQQQQQQQQQQRAGSQLLDPVSAAAAAGAGGGGVRGTATDLADTDMMDIDDSDENRDPSAAAGAGGGRGRGRGGTKGKGKAAGGMPPPAPKGAGRQRKGAAAAGAGAAAAGGMRQAGLMEAFARGGSQGGAAGGGVGSPQGKTGSNLNGLLTTTTAGGGGGGGNTPSQATSRSRSAAGSVRGRGSRGGRAGRGGRGRGRKAAAAAESEELLDSEDGDDNDSSGGGGGRQPEGISDVDEADEQPPAKKARRAGGTSSRPSRAAAKRQINYADMADGDGDGNGDGDDGLISSDDADAPQQQQQHNTQQTRKSGRRTAGASAQHESISDDSSMSLPEDIEDSDDDDDDGGGGGGGSRRGAAAGRSKQKSQKQTQKHSQASAGGGSVLLGPNSIDGGFVDSDSDDGGGGGGGGATPATAAAAAPASTAGGGRRRRVLPGSLASS